MANGLKKIIELAKKSRENCIIVDENGNPEYVIVAFDRYQELLSVGQKPQSTIEQKVSESKPVYQKNSLNEDKKNYTPTEPEDAYYFEPID